MLSGFTTSLRPDEQNKSEIARIAAKASERANIVAEVRSMERADAAKRKIEAAGARIRAREEAEAAKRERAEAEARARAEAKIRERAERTRVLINDETRKPDEDPSIKENDVANKVDKPRTYKDALNGK